MSRVTKEEGHYTIKRVPSLPKRGNANWLYAIMGPDIKEFYRWDAFKLEYDVITLGLEVTSIEAGDNVGVIGAGSVTNPYIISSDIGLRNIVEDVTPQLGGDLDGNKFKISLDSNRKIVFDKDENAHSWIESDAKDVFGFGGGDLIVSSSKDIRFVDGSLPTDYTNVYARALKSSLSISEILADTGDVLVTKDYLESTTSATNLDYVPSPTDGKVTSDTGTDATVPLADATNAGLLSPEHFIDLTSGVGDKNYIHDQGLASSTWTVNHGLNKRPSVTVVDTAGTEHEAKVFHVDNDNLVITHNNSFSGKAYLN